MSSRDKHEPKHRAPSAKRAPQAALRTSLTLSAMAVLGTGLAVSGGALAGLGGAADADLASAADGARDRQRRRGGRDHAGRRR